MQHNSKPVPIKRNKLIPDDQYVERGRSKSGTKKQRRINKRNQKH